MREILFRGKRILGKQEWTYGVPFIDHEGDCIFKTSATEFIVDGKTVGQYTGLTDKNGTKIFEGDIVQCYFADRYKEKGTIRWSNQDVRFSFVTFDGKYNWGIDDTDKFEVIGNIHDNPELLKGE